MEAPRIDAPWQQYRCLARKEQRMALDLDVEKTSGRGKRGSCAVDPTLASEFSVRIACVRKSDGTTIASLSRSVSKKHVEKCYDDLLKAMP